MSNRGSSHRHGGHHITRRRAKRNDATKKNREGARKRRDEYRAQGLAC